TFIFTRLRIRVPRELIIQTAVTPTTSVSTRDAPKPPNNLFSIVICDAITPLPFLQSRIRPAPARPARAVPVRSTHDRYPAGFLLSLWLWPSPASSSLPNQRHLQNPACPRYRRRPGSVLRKPHPR